ncbi:hypothetical protein ACUN9Y_10260 [Halomonas sp. V046]|uniref:hypothetical protein n=1 Tax=Halomonas sp. V046 TaxID=3459611 RepID=UPI004044CAAA
MLDTQAPSGDDRGRRSMMIRPGCSADWSGDFKHFSASLEGMGSLFSMFCAGSVVKLLGEALSRYSAAIQRSPSFVGRYSECNMGIYRHKLPGIVVMVMSFRVAAFRVV